MAAEALGPDALKLALVALMGAAYATYKFGLIDKIRSRQGEQSVTFRPRPVYPPGRIRFDKAVLDICGINQLQLIRTTSRLRKMGFWIVGDFALPTVGAPLGPRQKAYARAFVHGEEPVYALIVERHGPKTPPMHVDFITLFVDQTFLTATNSDEGDDHKRPGALRFHKLSGLLPEELFQHHRANLEALRGNWLKAVPASRDAFFSHYRQWLAIDYELRRAKDEEIRKDTLYRALEALPPLDIGPILKRYDGQRAPLEALSRGGVERHFISEPSSPTIIRDPERAPIRRRLPPSGPSAEPAAGRPAGADFGDTLGADPEAFQEVVYDVPPEVAQAHPLDLFDRLEAETPQLQSAGYQEAPAPDYAEPEAAYLAPQAYPEAYPEEPPAAMPVWEQSADPLASEFIPAEEFAFGGIDLVEPAGDPFAVEFPEEPLDDSLGTPTDPPVVIDSHAIADILSKEIRISLSQIKSWRPPDFTDPDQPSLLEPPAVAEPDAPQHCPHCRARTLSRYSQRCHKCRRNLLEAVGE